MTKTFALQFIYNLYVLNQILKLVTMPCNFLLINCLNAVTFPAALQSTGNSSVFNELSKVIDNSSVIVSASSFRTLGLNITFQGYKLRLGPI